jgi:hypothetical protein
MCTSENRDFLTAGVGAFSARNVKISVGIFLRVISAFGINPMLAGHVA